MSLARRSRRGRDAGSGVSRRYRGDRGRRLGASSAARGLGWARDLADAARILVRNPLYSVMAAATLALGIGATTAIYSGLSAVLLDPLPYAEPDRIYRAWKHLNDGTLANFSFRVVDYREHATGSSGRHGDAVAVAYVQMQVNDGDIVYGVGSHQNIVMASLQAIVSGLNRALDQFASIS